MKTSEMESDAFVILPDQTYKNIAHAIVKNDSAEYRDSDSDDDSDISAEEYLKEMETILRNIRRRKRTKFLGIAGIYIYIIFIFHALKLNSKEI